MMWTLGNSIWHENACTWSIGTVNAFQAFYNSYPWLAFDKYQMCTALLQRNIFCACSKPINMYQTLLQEVSQAYWRCTLSQMSLGFIQEFLFSPMIPGKLRCNTESIITSDVLNFSILLLLGFLLKKQQLEWPSPNWDFGGARAIANYPDWPAVSRNNINLQVSAEAILEILTRPPCFNAIIPVWNISLKAGHSKTKIQLCIDR